MVSLQKIKFSQLGASCPSKMFRLHFGMLPNKMLCRVPKIWGRAAPRNRFAVLPNEMRCRIPNKEGPQKMKLSKNYI
jgi:hypothetical protein